MNPSKKHAHFAADTKGGYEDNEQPLLSHETASSSSQIVECISPFQAVSQQTEPPRQAGGVFRDKHGKFRNLYDQRARTTVLINCAGVLERTNEQILPSLYKYVGSAFDASPRELGFITLSCALVQAIFAPVGGLLGHYWNRITVLSTGCFIWASMAAAFSFCNSVTTGALVWSLNGIGLALLIPNAQSLIADYFKPVSRGTAFGSLYLTGALGGMFGALFATNFGHLRPYDMDGWRVAFLFVAFLSFCIGVLNLLWSVDPRYKAEPQYAQEPDIFKQRPISLARITADVGSVLAVPSFIIVVLQGIVGSTPWNALVFNTLYLQLLGFSDFHASLIASLFLAGTAVGSQIGGVIGDIAAKRSPNHGRIVVAQFSVGIGVPLSAIIYKFLFGTTSVLVYSIAFTLWGLLISWSGPACISPLFSEVVPSQQRSIVFSFDRAFEGAVAAMGAPVVGWLAERMGFSKKGGPSMDIDSARALGDAMLLCTAIPWALCALLYSGLHITYRRDRTAAQAYQRARSGFFSTTVLPTIDEEREIDEADREAAVAAMGSRRMPLVGRGVVVLEGGRSRSV